jgi:hypothetical protein
MTGGTGGNGTGGSSPPAPLRLLAPLSTATVTSWRPTLRWQLAGDSDGAHVQICRDRACTTELTSFDATGTHGAPASDLPSGVLFWRAYARSGGTTALVSTPTWQFTVGARSAPIDASWGTTLDVNGDGYADVLVGGDNAAYLYLGSATGLSSSPDLTLLVPGSGNYGCSVASAGDVNGDGYADVIVGDDYVNGFVGRAYVYLGSPTGLSSSAAVTLNGLEGSDTFYGNAVASAGDVNGDGYADVIVGDSVAGDEPGSAYVYLGSAAGVAASPAVTLLSPGNVTDFFGDSVASAGDVNGDGYGDVIVGAQLGADNMNGAAYLYLGGAAGLASSPAAILVSPAGTNGGFGWSVASAGDVNGDGYADVIVGAYTANGGTIYNSVGEADVYLGGAGGLALSPAVTLPAPDGVSRAGGEEFGWTVAGAGDVNDDGYADVVVSIESDEDFSPSYAYVYLGSASGPAASPSVPLMGPAGADGSGFGYFAAVVGDVNGDGRADIVIGDVAMGQAYLYLGSAAGPPSSPSTALSGPASDFLYGQSVAASE